MTDLQLLRKTIADAPKHGFDDDTGDGETTIYQLSHAPVADVQVWVNNVLKVITTHYTIDLEAGVVTFVTPPPVEHLVEIKYTFSVFGDAELLEFLTLDGSVLKTAIRCFEILLADSARRFDYASGLTDLKPSQVFDHLNKLLEYFKKKSSEGDGTNASARLINRSNRYYDPLEPNDYIGKPSNAKGGDLSRDEI